MVRLITSQRLATELLWGLSRVDSFVKTELMHTPCIQSSIEFLNPMITLVASKAKRMSAALSSYAGGAVIRHVLPDMITATLAIPPSLSVNGAHLALNPPELCDFMYVLCGLLSMMTSHLEPMESSKRLLIPDHVAISASSYFVHGGITPRRRSHTASACETEFKASFIRGCFQRLFDTFPHRETPAFEVSGRMVTMDNSLTVYVSYSLHSAKESTA